MANHVIKKDGSDTIVVTAHNESFVLKKGITLDVTDVDGFSNLSGFDDISYKIDGRIKVNSYEPFAGIDDWGDNATVEVGESGSIKGRLGIALHSEGATITNAGKVSGSEQAILVTGADFSIKNTGEIWSSVNAINGYAGGKVVNAAGAEITGKLQFGTEDDVTVVNKGIIDREDFQAITFSAGDDTLVNRGTIKGSVYGNNGDDIFDLRNGRTSGQVAGGLDSDTYIINDLKSEIVEAHDEGTDTVKAFISFTLGANFEKLTALGAGNITLTGNELDNTLFGNSGNNILLGLDGEDILIGGSGNDTLTGGLGDSDQFVFSPAGGVDKIMDFTSEGSDMDVIQLNFIDGIESYEDVLDRTTIVDGKTTIDLGDGNKIILVDAGDLSEENFKIVTDFPMP